MRFSVLFFFFIFATISITFADDKNSSSVEPIKSNNTDALDGKLTIEEQYDEKNDTLTSDGTKSPSTKGSSLPTSSAGPTVKTTTTKPGKPKSPSFTFWSFFIGIFVAFLIIGLAAFVVKFWCQRRTPGHNVAYTAYQ